ncbi:MAG: hypothetical protein ACPG8W_26030, partial [Candidatus Promineifilaceae bacterium]
MFHIRQTDGSMGDHERECVVWNDVWPHQRRLPQMFRHSAENAPITHAPRFYLAETADGTPIARGSIYPASVGNDPLKYYVHVMVRPAWRGGGVCRAMSEQLKLALAGEMPVALIANLFGDEVDGSRLLDKLGFELKQRSPISEIEVAAFDSAEFLPALARAAENNITINTFQRLHEQHGHAYVWSQLYHLRHAIARDIPHYDSSRRYPNKETWIRNRVTHPNLLPDGMFIALHHNNWIGVSELYRKPAMPELLGQGITGVRRAYRRMGIATALKLRTLDYA